MIRPVFEQPPVTMAENEREYLTRMFEEVQNAFSTIYDMEPNGQLPEKLENGMLRYFLETESTGLDEGLYFYLDGAWCPCNNCDGETPPVDPPVEPPVDPPVIPPEPPGSTTPDICTLTFDKPLDNSYNRTEPAPNDTVILGDISVNTDMSKYNINPYQSRTFGYFVPPGCVKVSLEAMDVGGAGWTQISHEAWGCNGQYSEGYQSKPNIIFWEGAVNQCDDLNGAIKFTNDRNTLFTVVKMQVVCTIGPDAADSALFWDWYVNGAVGGTTLCSTQTIDFNACGG